MKLFVAIYDDARLLSHFLKHYAKAGATDFFVALDDQVRQLTVDPPPSTRLTLVRGLDVADSFFGGNVAVTEMRGRYQEEDEWAIVVDLDEFIEFRSPVADLLQSADRHGANIIKGTLFDRFSADGTLVGFGPDSDLPRLYPIKARFIKNLMKGADYKGIVVKGSLRARIAHHEFENEILYPEIFEISHYKWSNVNALERVRFTYRTLAERGAPWAWEYKNILDHYDRYGRFAWETFGGEMCSPAAAP